MLIPATKTMPALRDADPDGTWLDRACLARADLVPSLARVLRVLAGAADLPAAVRRLHGDDRATFDVVATFVAGTYYMVPQVRELIGYPGSCARPPRSTRPPMSCRTMFSRARWATPVTYRPA